MVAVAAMFRFLVGILDGLVAVVEWPSKGVQFSYPRVTLWLLSV